MAGKKVAIIQSNYVPWKGYFDIINSVDLFVFHDDIQFTTGDWRNRNKIKTDTGTRWITIPCGRDEKRKINEVRIGDFQWQRKHWNLISNYYSKAPFFNAYKNSMEDIYINTRWTNLSEFNQFFIKKIAIEWLGVRTNFEDSSKFNLIQQKADRVLELLKKVGATEYISGPAAKAYLNSSRFTDSGIKLKWMDYSDYKEYNQLYPPFIHNVSILDLLFNEGPNARFFLKSVK